MSVLELNNIMVRAREALLLDGISLRIGAGEAVAIVGPNGAGKSTLMRLLSGELKPTSGSVVLGGREIGHYAPNELALRRAILSQHIQVGFAFTVEEIVRMGLPQGARGSDTQITELLHEIELPTFRDRDFTTLSGGEQQRAHFARTLLQLRCGEERHGPGVLLLDEPTSSLDLRHQIKLVDVARERARQGSTVVAVLHDLNLAARFAERIIVLDHGRLVADGKPADIVTAELLASVFKVNASVALSSDGKPSVLMHGMALAQDAPL